MELLIAQTWLAQGAAGIGPVLLRRSAFEHQMRRRIVLPDSALGHR